MMASSSTKPLALTCGDPAGVGPEIIASWARAYPDEAVGCVALGPASWSESIKDVIEVESVEEPPGEAGAIVPGQPTAYGARLALAAMERAAAGCRTGSFSGVVTGPVSKQALAGVGFQSPGQTEFFASQWGGNPTMAFASPELNVVLATWHMPLAAVGPTLQSDPAVLRRAVERAHELAFSLKRSRSDSPVSIGVCGLNPHAGEAGLLGSEEREFLDPQLDQLRERFPGLSSCLPGDTVFWRARQGDFDVVIALYHDQGLAPLKTLAFDSAVNVTLGLPWVRTSPDHGTAFDLAGSGQASYASFRAAVGVARELVDARCS